MEALLREWTKLHNTIHVISGVILDSDYDGSRDPEDEYKWWTDEGGGVAVPTQYYVIAVRCLNEGMVPETCQYDQLDAIGFLFQHPLAPGVSVCVCVCPILEIKGLNVGNDLASFSLIDHKKQSNS